MGFSRCNCVCACVQRAYIIAFVLHCGLYLSTVFPAEPGPRSSRWSTVPAPSYTRRGACAHAIPTRMDGNAGRYHSPALHCRATALYPLLCVVFPFSAASHSASEFYTPSTTQSRKGAGV